MILIGMNYERVYSNLMERAKNRVVETYTEIHHIIPRCIGGDNSSHNLVRLTYREHFIAHWLLHRMYPHNRKLAFAFTAMTMDKHKNRLVDTQWTPSSIQLEELKLTRMSARRGKPHTKETRMKISVSNRNSEKGKNNPRVGYKATDETKALQSMSAVNRWKTPSEKTLQGIERTKNKRMGSKRTPMSNGWKDSISIGIKNRVKITDAVIQQIVELYNSGIPKLQIHKSVGVSRPTINVILNKYNTDDSLN